MLDTVRLAFGRPERGKVCYECRACGTAVPDGDSQCRRCGSTEIATYEL